MNNWRQPKIGYVMWQETHKTTNPFLKNSFRNIVFKSLKRKMKISTFL